MELRVELSVAISSTLAQLPAPAASSSSSGKLASSAHDHIGGAGQLAEQLATAPLRGLSSTLWDTPSYVASIFD